jgi:hypothetical protein
VALTAAAVPLWVHLRCRNVASESVGRCGPGRQVPPTRRDMRLYLALGHVLLNGTRAPFRK